MPADNLFWISAVSGIKIGYTPRVPGSGFTSEFELAYTTAAVFDTGTSLIYVPSIVS